MPKLYDLHNQPGHKVPLGAKYVGRRMPGLEGSSYANPYRIDARHSREEVLARYRNLVDSWGPGGLAAIRLSFRGYDLACWCVDWEGTGTPPGLCHGELLLQIANAPMAAREGKA